MKGVALLLVDLCSATAPARVAGGW
jgi:hypothetical protein